MQPARVRECAGRRTAGNRGQPVLAGELARLMLLARVGIVTWDLPLTTAVLEPLFCHRRERRIGRLGSRHAPEKSAVASAICIDGASRLRCVDNNAWSMNPLACANERLIRVSPFGTHLLSTAPGACRRDRSGLPGRDTRYVSAGAGEGRYESYFATGSGASAMTIGIVFVALAAALAA